MCVWETVYRHGWFLLQGPWKGKGVFPLSKGDMTKGLGQEAE